jgi:cytochrome c biogenesis factor
VFESEVNLLLINNLNKYHPLLLYFSAFSIICIGSLGADLFRSYHNFYYTKLLQTLLMTIHLNVLLSLTSVSLGGWWALQEGTWGGWWNWDSSEVLGLIVILISLIWFHKIIDRFTTANLFKLVYGLLILFANSYFLVQLSFELTSHNFGNKFNGLFHANLALVESWLVLTLLFYWLLRWLFSLYSSFLTINYYKRGVGDLKLKLFKIILYITYLLFWVTGFAFVIIILELLGGATLVAVFIWVYAVYYK